MTDPSPGELLAETRKELGLTQARFAEMLGVSTVLISKLESGARAPSAAFLRTLDAHLPDRAVAVRAAADALRRGEGRAGGGVKIVDAMRLAKQNAERARRLRSRADQIQEETNAAARLLDEKVEEFRREVFGPAAALLTRISDLPEESLLSPSPARPDRDSTLSQEFDEAQRRTSRNVFALLDAGALGGGPDPAGVATTTYMTIAGLAFASTGAAISGLSARSATSATAATLTAIGGGSLSAGGLSIAGATAVLTGIIGAPVVLAAASALVASGGRILERQRAEEQRIRGAEEAFGANEAVLRRFTARAGRITEILTVAILATRNHRRILENAVPGARAVAWSSLDEPARASVRRVLEIALACVTVLSLPIGMTLKQGAPSEGQGVPPLDDTDVPALDRVLDPRLESGPDLTNEFIDFAIEESFTQIAK